MSESIISCQGIGKRYLQLDTPTARLRHMLSPERSVDNGVWALAPCDIEIRRGEAVGIVGRNGSGKSTLLSMIAGILTPTVGTINVNGRVSALLELGSGFNLEFTGRDNAFYNGMLHGFSREQIEERFHSIEAFADIGGFIDRPVKTYSSGMFVRLAFAVAVSVDPDILIIDEALAVGDVFFQQKCFERLREMRDNGTTLLFVSHNSAAVYRFCDRAILLERGKLVLTGKPKLVIETYEAALIAERDHSELPLGSQIEAPSAGEELDHEIHRTDDVVLDFIDLADEDGHPISTFVSESVVSLRVSLTFAKSFSDPHVGFKIRNAFGDVIFETTTYGMKAAIGNVEPGENVVITFPFHAPLRPGDYTITLGVADSGHGEGLFRHQLVYRHDLCSFVVLRNLESIQWDGIVNLSPGVSIKRPISRH
jgi:lipopolysaccharide transport system ATP-binding protein